jgi:hypothetical protein
VRARKCKRRGCARGRRGRSLAKRYGCFRLPTVPGATVKEAKRADVTWLARTDPDAKEIEFSHHWDRLDETSKRYIVLHERAHLETGPDHDDRFYGVLKRLIAQNRVPWKLAFALENWNCHKSH